MKRRIISGIAGAALILLCLAAFYGCVKRQSTVAENGPAFSELKKLRDITVRYATQFSASEYEGGYILTHVKTSGDFLIVPDESSVPTGIPDGTVVIKRPERIYLAATSAMDFFRALDAIDAVRLSGTKADGWYIEEAKQAMHDGRMLFAGKYSAPDYELIYSEGCDLAVESTMIYHSPEIKEQLEKLGVPVIVERSSYENDPLGRMEWIKFYGLLLGKSEQAERIFDEEAACAEPLSELPESGKTVAFFYITASGTVNVRKSSDYVPVMIEMAGGKYIFDNIGDESALSTVNMTMEAFYDNAKDADILIYNSTIDNELYEMSELIAKDRLLADFKAVKSGDVWCTGKDLFQQPMGLGRMIADLHIIFTGGNENELSYLHRLGGK